MAEQSAPRGLIEDITGLAADPALERGLRTDPLTGALNFMELAAHRTPGRQRWSLMLCTLLYVDLVDSVS